MGKLIHTTILTHDRLALSLSSFVFLLFFICVLLLSNMIYNKQIEVFSEKLVDALRLVAYSIDYDKHVQLSKSFDKAIYDELTDSLGKIHAIYPDRVKSIYTYTFDPVTNKMIYILDSGNSPKIKEIWGNLNTTEPAEYGYLYPMEDIAFYIKNNPEWYPSLVKTGFYVDSSISTDQWGDYYSATYAVKDNNGNISYYIGIDVAAKSFTQFTDTKNKILYMYTFVAFIVALILWYITRELSIKNEKIRKMLFVRSVTDQLTGAYNRTFLIEESQKEIKSARRYSTPLTCLMLDIDFFKKINDDYGHDVGDTVLKSLVSTLNAMLRTKDILCRWGGEEFVILLPYTTLTGGVSLAKRIQKHLKTVDIKHKTGIINITISIGVSQVIDSDETIIDTVNRADILLYIAKKLGRNRVEYEIQSTVDKTAQPPVTEKQETALIHHG